MENNSVLLNKMLVVGIFVLFAVMSIIPSSATNFELNKPSTICLGCNTLYVGGTGSGNYTKIQDAIDDTSDGDTVFVYDDSSPYYENVNVTKSINLIGEDKNTTIIDGMRKSHVLYVKADNVYISGFTIQKSSLEFGSSYSGIRAENDTENISIEQNIITENLYGITFQYSNNCRVLYNTIKSNDNYGIWAFGGINPCNNISYIGNEIIGNDDAGIKTIFSPNSTISYNIIRGNGIGIDMQWHSNNSLISNNVITNSYFYGFWLVYTHRCTVRNNYFKGSGLKELCVYQYEEDTDSSNHSIYHNTIIGDTFDEGFSWWDNGYPSGGNYYSTYTGGDKFRGLNQNIPGSDCIGDTPYNIPGSSNKDWYPLVYEWGENPPVSDFTYIADNYTSLFNASSSYDRDGNVISYDWDFGDGTSGTGMIISHIYSVNGTYNVTLTVVDNDGKQGTFSRFYRTYNDPPYYPSNPNPVNGSTSADVNAYLSWNCSDPNGDSLTFTVYFEANDPSPDTLVSDNQTSLIFDPYKMDYNTDYYWQIVAWDPYLACTIGPIWNFTTESNAPPEQPISPQPDDGERGVDIDADLSWECSDPDGDALAFDVYFEVDDPTPDEMVSNNQSEKWYDPGTMEYNTHYYWQIVAWDEYGASKSGPIWDFTTGGENNPPNSPSDPYPVNGSINVDVDVNLSWNGGDPDEDDTVFYDVYLEADDQTPDVKVAANLINNWFNPNTLKYNTTYYWQIVAKDNHYAKTKGPIWHFTTEVNLPPSAPSVDGPSSGKTGQEYYFYVNSVDPEDHHVFYYVDWGDGTNTDWSGPYISGKKTSFQHAWDDKGTYLVKVKAKDTYDAESDWSEFEVSIPRVKVINFSLFQWLFEHFPLLNRILFFMRGGIKYA